MKKFPWLKLRKKTDPEFPVEPPIWLGNHSNGEYFHNQTPREARIRKEILRRAEEQARYLGLERREFLASSMGMALSLSVLNEACSSETERAVSKETPFVITPEATCDPSAYIDTHSPGKYFIMDVQTHAFDNGEWRDKQIGYPIFLSYLPTPGCTESVQLDCFNQHHYGELMFVESDTTMSVITSWPGALCLPDRDILSNSAIACGLPLSNQGMRDLRDFINQHSLSQRVINQIQVMPNDHIEMQIDGMRAAMEDSKWRCGSWKAYPAWRSDNYLNSDGLASGYFMTDKVGRMFIEEGLRLGVPNFAIHKGLPIPGFDTLHNEPTDIGQIAVDYQDANFVIYHSAYAAGTGEGNPLAPVDPVHTEAVPYSATGPVTGVNMLIRDLIEKGLIDDPDHPGTKKPGLRLNVYAEMGAVWNFVMTKPNLDAQHYIGKLLKYLGPDNIVWGTDCILYGSPQAQIDAFKAFKTLDQFRAPPYNYPELTDDIKRKIFGLNAARLYRIDPEAARCQAQTGTFAMYKQHLDGELGGRRWALRPPSGPKTLREFWDNAKKNRARGVPG